MRHHWVAAAGLLVVVLAAPVLLAPGGTGPDVLVISVNSLRADHLSCYGYERNTTPNICSLAEDGTRYTQAFSQYHWTTPSEASIQSGLYPAVHGVGHPDSTGAMALPPTPTLAGTMAAAGYDTVGAVPTGPWEYRENTDLTRGFGTVVPINSTAEAVPGIVDHLVSEGDDLVYALPMELHRPYTHEGVAGSERFVGEYDGVLAERRDAEGDMPPELLENVVRRPDGGYQVRYEGERINLTQEDIAYVRAEYDSMLYHIDQQLGRILDGLRRAGAYEDTLIIVTAPHGELLADDRSYPLGHAFGHLYNYEEVLRVPLIIKPPGGSSVGVVDEPVELIDLYPTVLDWVGTEAPWVLQGSSVRPPYEPEDGYTYSGRRLVRNESWKLLEARPRVSGELVLYNRSVPPAEREDVSGRHPGIVADMRDRLQDWRDRNELLRSQMVGR